MQFKAFLEKSTWLLTAIAGLLLAALVYATVDRTKYTLETLVVVPDTASSTTWLKTENTLIAEVSENALYQDFTTNNSAYIDAGALITVTTPAVVLPTEEVNNGSTTSAGEDGTTGEVTDETQGGESETLPPTAEVSAPEPEGEMPPAPADSESEPEATPEPEASVPEPEAAPEASVSARWGLFPLAQEVITETVNQEENISEPAPDPEPEVVVPVEELETAPTEEVSDTPDITEAETLTETEVVNEEETATDELGEEVTEDSTDVVGSEEELSAENLDEAIEEDVEEEIIEEPVYNVMDDCAEDPLCQLYSTTFTGFAMPEFESGTFLAGAELRLSLGAKTKSGVSGELQRFVVEYTYNPEEPWRVATVVDIEDEASNSINGGYYLVALEKPAHQSQLANLAVRVSYQGNIENLDRAYVEGVWLEVTSAEFYEETDPDYLSTAIPYDRDLLSPKFHELTETDLDPALSDLPSFTLSYDPQRGFLRRAFSAIFSENQYEVDSVRVIDRLGAVVEVPVDVVYHEDLTWTVQFLEQPQKLVPGKYTVELTVNENETLFVDSFEFYWGVLAVNTTKTMYHPGEEVTFNLAALTEEGDTICDARLELKVVDPEYVITEIPVNQSGECGKNNVTDVPDYLANFVDTNKAGVYTIQLQHLNRDGEVVHNIEDSFEVREFVDFDIERTAPTRIYPPAPYRVGLTITANRDFTGDITERVPRGFVLTEISGNPEILTLPTHTELVWRAVTMLEGDKLELTYTFDAPDISPYMYLLGPLSMDGFQELRQWQIASDALTAIASFTGTRTVAGTNLNQTESPMQWSTSTLDTFYFDHATSTNSHEITLRQAGDYYVALTLPQQRTDGNNSRTRVGAKVYLNGVVVPESLGRSGYIRNQNGHAESSSHAHFLLTNVAPDDVLEVYVEGLTTIDAGDIVNVTGRASLLLEYIGTGAGVFAATTTETTNSTNLNQTTEYPFSWVETRQDSGFVHSDSINPEQIVISNPGTYYVSVNVPMTTNTAQTNVRGRVLLDGVLVPGGHFSQGYSQSAANEGDGDSSMHWSGIVVATTTNQVLTLVSQREASAGTVTVTSGFSGSVYIRELPTTEVLALRGTAVVGGTNWNPAAAAAVQWSTGLVKDAAVFTHSTSSNTHQITIAADGDYFVSYNDAINGAVARANSRVSILKNGTAIPGAQSKSHYIRNQSGQTESSAALALLVEGLVIGDVITVTVQQEASAGTLNDTTDGILFMWKKAEIDFRPEAPSMYNAPFDNIRFASTTPYFDFSATDPDGTSNIEYEFSISTSTGFVASTTFNSGVDSEFSNTASSTDTSPFVEGNKIRLQLTSGDALTDLTTYYWRVRARDITGSGEFGDWSTTQSLTVDMAAVAPSWFQSYSGQFEGDSLVGTVSSGGDRVQVDASVSPEILLAYGEGTVTTPRFRFWDGTSWGVEGSAVAVTNTINWLRTDAAVSRDEYAMVTLDASNDAYAQIYSASTSSWGNLTLLSSVVTSAAYRGVAVAYESQSGDAMAVSCTNGPSPVYRIWNGSSWSATSTISVSSPNNCNFLEIASDPASDELILVVRDTGTQYEALVWDGSAWTDSRVIGSSAKVAREGMTVAYEASGDQAIIAVSNNTNNNIIYTTWNGVEFSTNATQAIGNDFEFGRLTPDANSDAMALCYIDEDNDLGVLRWDGGVWSTFTELDTLGNADTGRPIECRYETLSGRSDYLMAPYSDDTAVRYRTATSTTFATEASVGTIQDSYWVQSARAGDGVIVAVTLDDVADDLFASTWNGSSWSAETTIETSPSSVIAAPYEMYDLSSKRFLFSEGIVETPPIDFSAVPNQPTWGDVTFDTIEPFGTDVQVRVRFSSTTVCDAYIPDIALPGNSAGFDISDAPIDLTGLSTTTYDQICLEASLTTLGSESATLEEWTLSWVRQPKLIQSNYRWYVNGSFLTPTDAWPLGAVDLGENGAISSDMAVSVNETLRLRLALAGANVALPAFSEVFKLQYAEGLTCSNSLSWYDVGSPASTTALWRGYANSIIGSDWYGASWTRRVKVTVDSAVVEEGVTDFPVYINLSDLPSAFFASVQSDGDDIRITEADGVTEVPYELVSINTGTESGELHFKADLASTTDTEFFIYYGNPSASGYSVSATYGRNNVWTNNYRAVYHFNQNPTGAAPQFVDSTGNSNGSAFNLEGGDLITGRVGNAITFDGVNEYITTTVNTSLSTSTWSIWMNPTSMPQGAYDGVMLSRGTNTTGLNMNSTGARLGYHWNDAAATYNWNGGPTIGAGQWSMAALVIGQSSATEFLFTATGTASGTNATTHAASTINALYFGGDTCCGGRYYNGAVDEARLIAAVRTQGWLQTEFNNHSNPTGFYGVSSEEKVSDGRLLPSALLTDSDLTETYEEENPTRDNQNTLPVGDEAEWDFVLQNNGATANTNYCFRMVYEDGAVFSEYTNYPRVITNAEPLAPELYTPFDNERLASTTPWFEFAATDELGDLVAYEIQVDTDVNFGSPDISTDSIANFAQFTNLLQPAQKSEFTSGQRIRFENVSALSNNTTYWWRVRAIDPNGSGGYGDWSTSQSVTITSGTAITTWYQTTGDQFSTDNLLDAVSSTSTNDVAIDVSFSLATITSSAIDYDKRTTGNAWGDLTFTQNVTSGTIRYRIEYLVSGSNYELVPDVDLAGNAAGFTTSPVSLTGLNTTTYNEIRIVAVLSGNSTLPRLQDWTVTWAETIEVPTPDQPFDNAKVSTTTPAFTFVTTDPENDGIQYQLQLSASSDFTSSSTFTSGVDAGFVNTINGGDTSPFNSGETIRYTAQSALTNGNTYWWRTRARDPGGDNVWSDYSEPYSFTVDTAITVSAWHQTTGQQFDTDTLTSIETTSGAAEITSTLTEVMMAYGEGSGQAPRYRLWDGSAWGAAGTAESVGAQIRWTDLEAAPTRPEYALGTIGTDADVNVQIYDADNDSWDDIQELSIGISDTLQRGFDIAYETDSGDLLAVSCRGVDATYSVWNGTSWTATSTLNLANANNCLTVTLASDPTTDEIVAAFKHTNTAASDFQLLVWNGSTWGNSLVLGGMNENGNYGVAMEYEESGDQAIVALSNELATTLLYALWNGSAWSTSTQALGDHMEWAGMHRDVGTDQIALCYVDNDTDAGVLLWNGSAFNTFTEIETTARTKAGQVIDCVYETNGTRDGYLMIPYSDGTNARYQVYATSSFSGELTLSSITDSWRSLAVRGGDGLIHLVNFDDTNDRYDYSNWNGTVWSARQAISTTPSITGTPFDGSLSMAARTYPNFTSGEIRSTTIDFNKGSGPRWERVTFAETTPGISTIEYRLYYLASTSAYTLIPDSALPGNAAGFTTSPIDISDLDRTIYTELQLDAQLICLSGDCPVLNDWTVEWSEGITVSGTAYEYNASTTLTSGTVGVAVNGVLQSGKTGTILGDGTWTINNVTAFEDDVVTVFIEGAADIDEAVAVTKYDGIGDITAMQLARRNVTLGSADNPTLSNIEVGSFNVADDEDVFLNLNGSNQLSHCADVACGDAKFRVLAGTSYVPVTNSTLINFENYGTFAPATSTVRVGASWTQNGTFTVGESTVIFTATSTAVTLLNSTSTHSFYNVTFGETSGTATWTIAKPLSVAGNLNVTYGTLNRGTSTIAIEHNLQFGTNGTMIGLATTTFTGTGSYTWGDSKSTASSTNAGYVVVDGTAKTITLAGNVGAESVTIGADDTLNASGSGYNINVYRSWINNNAFIPQTGTVTLVGTSTGSITRGASAFNNLTFNGAGSNWSFTNPTLSLSGNLSIATGTVTLPTGTTTIAGSFTNTGNFLHNNGEVRMTSSASGRTITQSGTAFLNNFNDLVFAGTGSWSFTEANATTTRHFRIQSGVVTFPSTNLTVGGNFLVTGGGSFAHNNGTVTFLVEGNYEARANGSSFNHVRTTAGAVSWFNNSWLYRVPVSVNASQVQSDLTDYPVYINLADLPAAFFTNVKSDGSDIRVTTADGITEVPFEVVAINTVGGTGELHAKVNLADVTDTRLYIYYGNSAASAYAVTDTYGRNNVWTNGYTAVYHLEESPTASSPQFISSTGSTTGTSNNMEVGDRQAAQIGQGQAIDGTNEFIQTTYGGNLTTSTWSTWMRASGAQGGYDGVIFSRGAVTTGININSGGTTLGYHWNDAANTYSWNGGPTYPQNEWFMAALVVTPTAATIHRFAPSGNASGTNSVSHASSLINDLKFGQDDGGGRFFNGNLDEVRLATVARSNEWLMTEYNNHSSSSAFYTPGVVESRFIRTFADTNATILGNFTLAAGGDSILPTGTLSIGGSLDNNAQFTANGGTVRFNSTSGNETIDAGASSFATLEFNSLSGDFTVTEHATATVAINLTAIQQLTVASGKSLTTYGTFTNAVNTNNTTWTGSTLRLMGGNDITLNAKAHMGETYGTLEAASSTLVRMWNSSATTYVTTGTTSAIYSQDHAAVNGDLNIYGNYTRTSGTEYWTHNIDFDGAALTGSERQVDVKVASSSLITIQNASLSIIGTTTGTTTVSAISNAFNITTSNATLNSQYFSFAGTGAAGLNLTASTTFATFSDAMFTVTPGRTGISVDATTINANPSEQLFRINFATTTAGAANNVSVSSGTPTSFLWFRDGVGNLYGEAFDANDGNPGSVRFDDSSYLINVSGTVYSDDGVTTLGAPTCNGTTPNVQLVVDGGTYTASTSCNATTGAYSFSNVAYVGDPKVVVYLNTNGGVKGSAITKTPTTDITNMHIYANRVIVRHEDALPLTIADMALYDSTDDSDIAFTAVDAGSDTLTTTENTELYVFAGKTFVPNGNITLNGNGNANSYEGTLALGAGSTFTASGTETHTLAGRLVVGSGANFSAASSTVLFNATTTGKSVTSTSTITFHNVEFAGVGGGWNLGANIAVNGDMDVTAGTVTGTGDVSVNYGSLSGNGVLSLGSGTTTIARTNTLGGTSAWTFNNLILGNAAVVGTTTPASSATTTILGRLTIATAHYLDAGSAVFDLAGAGTVLVENGSFLEDTSTVRFSGAGAVVPSTSYYNLDINAGAGSATYTTGVAGILVYNNLTVGGAASTTLNVTANDPVFEVRGDVYIASNGTLSASNSANLTVLGDYTNDGMFSANGGTVRFTGSGSSVIAAGNSSFATLEIDGAGSFTVSEHATATVAFSLINHGAFTLATGNTLALGGTFLNNLAGALTTWTGSTLFLYGTSTYEINDSATSDTYETLAVGANSHIRMWNSSAATYNINSAGSLYSQDHAGVNGELYIYGALVRNSGDDFWSYTTDFDGTDLTGGNERAAEVYFASGASATYAGNATLQVLGTSTATTTLTNQGSGTYGLTVGGTAETEWRYASVRNIGASGVVFSGAPVVTDFSYTDLLVESNSGSAMTVGGTVINANEAKNFTNNLFAFSGGVTGAKNVTATGTSVSSWRFTNHTGNLAGEANDDDPAGDPGYVVWDDSAALITVSGNVYSDEGSTVSAVCDGSTANVRLVVAGLTTYNATCNASTGAYSISNVAFSPLDTLTLYINDETEKAANVTVAPISSISNLHLYENRVIVRHENTNPLTIADMAVWDSSDDADIPFTAVNAGTDTLTLPANRKLIVWTGKTFEPNGNVTLAGAGAGAAYDGTLEAQTNARFRAKGTESHSVGGSIIFGTGAEFVSGSSTLILTTTGAARTFDVNTYAVHNLTVSGVGSYVSSEAVLTINGSYAQSAGAFTFGTGTTTIGAAFNVTSGSFTNNGSPFVFTGTGAGNTVRFNNSVVASLSFTGSGSWNMTDTNATSTGNVLITAGGVTLPSGNFAVGGSFEKRAGTLTHNTSELIMTSATTATITASSSDLFGIRFSGGGSYVVTDTNITFLDSFTIDSGSVAMASGTTAVGGSFLATGGSFATASGTVLLNAASGSKVVNPGNSAFYNLQFGAPAGGYTLHSATTTNNLTISSVNSLTLNSGAIVTVGGVFLNSVGSSNTTWTNSTLRLNSASAYSINARSNAGDVYGTLEIGAGADVRMWYSSAATTTVAGSSSLYSQDHGNTNGLLNIYGDLTIASSTEYWSYATDFDGTSLSGSERAVTVRMAPNATTTITTGTLNIIGANGFETLIENQTTGTYSLSITGGTFNANYYEFADLDIFGLQFVNTPSITNLANGYFDLAVDTGSLITLSSTTLNANPSKIFDNVGFNATATISGYNVNLIGETANAWRFTNSYGSIDGEGYDIDGLDACGSVRFDNSSCLLVEQTHFRWRADNGGEGAPNSEWFNMSWNYRTKVRVLNNDSQAYASTAVKVILPYDSAMKSDFTDLRFTDDDGVTPLPFWIERYTASTEALVWVRLPDLPASDYAVVYAYYGNSGASASSTAATFDAFDDYEDNSLSEYSGDTSLFTTVTSPVYGGGYAIAPSNPSGKTTDGVFRFDQTVAQGKMIRYMQYVNTTGGSGDEPCTLFAVQSPGTTNQNYGVCLEQFGTDRISLARDVDNNDTSGVVLATSTVTYSTGWYEVEIDWRTNNTILVSLYNSAGTLVASTTATDSTYTSGGYGYAFWFQNGAWDSFTARNRVATKPTVYLGVRQGNGGAAWISASDSAGSAIPNNTVRLRLAIENSGLDVTGHQYRLEYAAKGVAPTCESVSTGNFTPVPNQASCGSSPVCMQTSTNLSDGDNTTDHLFGVDGTFTPGEVVESPSNEAAALDVDQYEYTELEYVLTPTSNASDSYCFRVTNAGTELDFYAEVAELGLQFDPTFGAIDLNGGLPINLTPATTTSVLVEGTVTDFNGVADITHATATVYRSGAGASCTPDNNSCYVASTDNGRCTLTGCTATSCTLSCVVDIYFHADPTDDGTYVGQEWLAYAEAEDFSNGYDFASAPGVELISLRAMAVDSLINYGSLAADSDTGSFNPTTTVTNLGNTPIDVDVTGTNLTDGGSSAISADLQKVATSTFTYSACVSCQQLSTSTAVTLDLNLSKPAVPTPPVETEVYWGIAVPFTASNAAHSGTNIFTAIGVD